MAPRNERVPDWLLERLGAGELPEGQAKGLWDRLKARGEEHRLSALATSNREILAALPPEHALPEIDRRAASSQRGVLGRVRPWWALSMATACAAAVAMILAVRVHKEPRTPVPESEQPENIGIKGDLKPVLRIYRKSASGAEILRPGAPVHQGDTLQIRYLAAGRRFGVIVSVDARGTVTLHLPEKLGQSAALERDGERALAHAYELDDSPGFERFLFVTSDAPFDASEVTHALKNGSALPSPLASFDLVLKKEKP